MKVNNYQAWAKELFGGACYAACISHMSGKDDAIDITRDILNGVDKGYVRPNGYVSQPHKFYNYCFGKDVCNDVKKVPYVAQPYDQIVCFEYKGGTHFVVMRDDKVVFDPSGDSNSVKYGKIKDARSFGYR